MIDVSTVPSVALTPDDTHRVVKVGIGKVMPDQLQDKRNVLLRRIQHCVGSCIVRIGCYLALTLRFTGAIQLLDQLHNRPRYIVHVEDGRRSVQARCVEVVRVGHGNRRKRIEIPRLNSPRNLRHAPWYYFSNTMLQQRRGCDGSLHASSRRCSLLGIADDTDQSLKIGPV